jgi:putative transposase
MVGVLATGQDGLEREHNQPPDMKNKAQKSIRNQGHSELAREIAGSFQEVMRAAMRHAAERMMIEEVTRLCGECYRPTAGAPYRRAGSEKGVLRYEGQKERITRPRVRTADGRREVALTSYEQMSQISNHEGLIERMVSEGISCRGLSRATTGALGKSSIAQQWARKGVEQLEALRSRDLSQQQWAGLMVDGVYLNGDLCVIVAMGITAKGEKQVLDFEVGASESASCAQGLMERLRQRGFGPHPGYRLLALCDGSKALHKALKQQWPDLLLQQCLVHVERHVLDRLKRSDRAEGMRLFKRLRLAQGAEGAQEAYAELERYLSKRHQGAQQSLQEAKENLLVVHGMELGEALQRSLLSTNCIENVMRNLRQHGHGVKRWRSEGPMVSRWMASGLMWLERGLHPLRGHQAMSKLMEALKIPEAGGGDRKMGASFPVSSLRSSPGKKAPILRHKCVAQPKNKSTVTPSPSA